MKLSILVAAASVLATAVATPAGTTSTSNSSGSGAIVAPKGFTWDASNQSPAPAPPLAEVAASKAAAGPYYWVCLAISVSNFQYGWSQGTSESAALSAAKKQCKRGDCTAWSCARRGCVGLSRGSTGAGHAAAAGYGSESKDRSKVASLVTAQCRKLSNGCEAAKTYCSNSAI